MSTGRPGPRWKGDERFSSGWTRLSHWISMPVLITVAETPEYIRSAEGLLPAAHRMEVVEYLAEKPKAGDLMQGTGGVRKLRWARGGGGKSVGVRVIYYFHGDAMPLYLLT